MVRSFLSSMLIFIFLSQVEGKVNISIGPLFSSYLLLMDDNYSKGKWNTGVEIGVEDIIPTIGLKLRGSKVRFNVSNKQDANVYEYIPLSLCTSFDILPFVDVHWLNLSLETGFGFYFWKGLSDDEVVVLESGEKMDEKDYGFVCGLTLQLKPNRYIGLEFSTRYNYIASSNISKYGLYDEDEKLWENGVGLKFIIP